MFACLTTTTQHRRKPLELTRTSTIDLALRAIPAASCALFPLPAREIATRAPPIDRHS